MPALNYVVLGKKCCHQPKTARNTSRRKKADQQSREGHWLKKGNTSRKKIPGSRGTPFKRRSAAAWCDGKWKTQTHRKG